jgi:hypothetical protein
MIVFFSFTSSLLQKHLLCEETEVGFDPTILALPMRKLVSYRLKETVQDMGDTLGSRHR